MKILNTRIKVQLDDNSVAELEAIGNVTEEHRKAVDNFTSHWKVLSMLPHCDQRKVVDIPIQVVQKRDRILSHPDRVEIALPKLPYEFTIGDWMKCFSSGLDKNSLKKIKKSFNYDMKTLIESGKIINTGTKKKVSYIYKIVEKMHSDDERKKAIAKSIEDGKVLVGTFK